MLLLVVVLLHDNRMLIASVPIVCGVEGALRTGDVEAFPLLHCVLGGRSYHPPYFYIHNEKNSTKRTTVTIADTT